MQAGCRGFRDGGTESESVVSWALDQTSMTQHVILQFLRWAVLPCGPTAPTVRRNIWHLFSHSELHCRKVFRCIKRIYVTFYPLKTTSPRAKSQSVRLYVESPLRVGAHAQILLKQYSDHCDNRRVGMSSLTRRWVRLVQCHGFCQVHLSKYVHFESTRQMRRYLQWYICTMYTEELFYLTNRITVPPVLRDGRQRSDRRNSGLPLSRPSPVFNSL